MRYLQWLLLFVTSIPATAHGQTKHGQHVDTSVYVVLKFDPKLDFFFGKSDHLQPATLSQAEVDDMEIFVDSAYQRLVRKLSANYPGLKPLPKYKRQYVPVINKEGQKEVWIGFYCGAPKGWRKGEILVMDGGACYLRLWVNLTLRKASSMRDNGLA